MFHMILYCFYIVFIWFYIVFIWFLGGVAEIFGWPVFLNFERSTGNSNVRPEIRTFDRNFRMTRFFEFWTFDRKSDVPPKFSDDPFLLNFERSTGNSTYDRNFRMIHFFEFWTFNRKFDRSTGNSTYHRNVRMTR